MESILSISKALGEKNRLRVFLALIRTKELRLRGGGTSRPCPRDSVAPHEHSLGQSSSTPVNEANGSITVSSLR